MRPYALLLIFPISQELTAAKIRYQLQCPGYFGRFREAGRRYWQGLPIQCGDGCYPLPKSTMRNGWKLLTFVIGLAIGALFLWAAVRDVDTQEVAAALGAADFGLAIPFLLVLGIFYWLKARRWAYLLAPVRHFSDRQLFPPMILGFAGNNVLPVRLGELLRIYLLGAEFGTSKTLALATLVLERVFDAICILLLVTLALLLSGVVSEDLSAASTTLALVTAVALAVVVVVVRPPEMIRSLASGALRRLPERIASMMIRRADALRQGFATISSPRSIALIAVNSLLQWMLLAGCILLSMQAFGASTNLAASMIVLGLLVVGISLPGAPGFIGTIELCFVIGLGLFGIDPSQALAIAIYYHVLTFGFVTVTGALLLPRYRSILARDPVEQTGAGISNG